MSGAESYQVQAAYLGGTRHEQRCSGCGLGFERLSSISEVGDRIPYPITFLTSSF